MANCVKMLSAGDSILLIESAVSLALEADFLASLPQGVQALVLADDLQARGLSQLAQTGITQLNTPEWVALTLEVDHVCSW